MKRISLLILTSIVFFSCVQGKEGMSLGGKNFNQSAPHLQRQRAYARQRAYLELFNRMDSRMFEAIVQALHDPDPYVRYTGAWALNPSHMDTISEMDPDLNYKIWIFPLSPDTSKEIVTALIDALPEDDIWARREILLSLSKLQKYQVEQTVPLDERAKRHFLDYIKDPDPITRAISVKGLQLWAKDPRVENGLRQALSDKDWEVRFEAMHYFKFDFQVLAETLEDSDFGVRVNAVRTISQYHRENPMTVDLLITRLGDTDFNVIETVLMNLRSFQEHRAVKPILALQEGKYPNQPVAVEVITGKPFGQVKSEYQREMKDFHLPPAPIRKGDPRPLVNQLKEGDRFERITAVHNSYWRGFWEKNPALLEGIHGDDPLIRYHFISDLEPYLRYFIIPDEKEEPIYESLVKATKDINPHVRREAIRMIGTFARSDVYNTRAIELINQLIEEESDPFLRHASISLLDEYVYKPGSSERKYVPVKAVNLIYSKLLNDDFSETRRILVDKVNLSCFPEAIDAMLDALKDPFSNTRKNAANKLKLGLLIHQIDHTKVQSVLRKISEEDPSREVRYYADASFKQNQRFLEGKASINAAPGSKGCSNDQK